MKTITALFLFSTILTFGQERFQIIGKFSGKKLDKVSVARSQNYLIDEIIIENRTFEIRGKIKEPGGVRIIVNDEYTLPFGIFVDGGTITANFREVPEFSKGTRVNPIIAPYRIKGNKVSKNENKILKYYRKKLDFGNIKQKHKNRLVLKTEKHIDKFPNSWSGLNLLGLFMSSSIMNDEKIIELLTKLPVDAQKSRLNYGPWIQSSVAERQTNFTGKKIINFSIPDAKGIETEIIDTTKNLTFIQFWSSWCGPCRSTNKKIVELIQRIDTSNVSFVNISLDEDLDAWHKAIEEDGITWLQLIEKDSFRSQIVKYFNFKSIPFDILIDKNYNIVSLGYSNSMEIIEQKYKK